MSVLNPTIDPTVPITDPIGDAIFRGSLLEVSVNKTVYDIDEALHLKIKAEVFYNSSSVDIYWETRIDVYDDLGIHIKSHKRTHTMAPWSTKDEYHTDFMMAYVFSVVRSGSLRVTLRARNSFTAPYTFIDDVVLPYYMIGSTLPPNQPSPYPPAEPEPLPGSDPVLTRIAVPAGAGTIQVLGVIGIDERVEIRATPNPGYEFDYWEWGAGSPFKRNPFFVTLTRPSTLYANFNVVAPTGPAPWPPLDPTPDPTPWPPDLPSPNDPDEPDADKPDQTMIWVAVAVVGVLAVAFVTMRN